jgi:hypothetical protein
MAVRSAGVAVIEARRPWICVPHGVLDVAQGDSVVERESDEGCTEPVRRQLRLNDRPVAEGAQQGRDLLSGVRSAAALSSSAPESRRAAVCRRAGRTSWGRGNIQVSLAARPLPATLGGRYGLCRPAAVAQQHTVFGAAGA